MSGPRPGPDPYSSPGRNLGPGPIPIPLAWPWPGPGPGPAFSWAPAGGPAPAVAPVPVALGSPGSGYLPLVIVISSLKRIHSVKKGTGCSLRVRVIALVPIAGSFLRGQGLKVFVEGYKKDSAGGYKIFHFLGIPSKPFNIQMRKESKGKSKTAKESQKDKIFFSNSRSTAPADVT